MIPAVPRIAVPPIQVSRPLLFGLVAVGALGAVTLDPRRRDARCPAFLLRRGFRRRGRLGLHRVIHEACRRGTGFGPARAGGSAAM